MSVTVQKVRSLCHYSEITEFQSMNECDRQAEYVIHCNDKFYGFYCRKHALEVKETLLEHS